MALPTAAIPTPAQVHARIARRPAFTTTSTPTAAQVDMLIADKAAEVDIEIAEGVVLPDDLVAFVRATIAYGVAADVEQTYFPEQQLGEDGAARSLAATYLRMLDRVRARLEGTTGGTRTARTASIALVDPALW